MANAPIRTCAGCRRRRPQSELIRVVRGPDGVVSLDRGAAVRGASGASATGRSPGRGAYVCADGSCIERALRTGAFVRALGRHGLELAQDLRAAMKNRV
ncbi:MAG: YlxR family protein [Actinomycetota bacterium]|nr:YlxR family protein [Actinomycetota bacterium]